MTIKAGYFQDEKQKDPIAGANFNENEVSAILAQGPALGQIELYYSGGHWYRRNTEPGWYGQSQQPDTQLSSDYIPPFKVKAIEGDCYPETASPSAAGYVIFFDSPFGAHQRIRCFAGQPRAYNITRVRLGAETTATRITLFR
jgi:hypothetical protein